MKKRVLFTCFFTASTLLNCFAQYSPPQSNEPPSTIVTVRTTDNTLIPSEGSGGEVLDEDLNDILQNFGITTYYQSMPFAQTPALHHLYDMWCDCDGNELVQELQNLNKFEGVYVSFDEEMVADLYDPADWMWQAHANDWLWHLKQIDAEFAWDLTLGCPSTLIAIIDNGGFDFNHPDLMTEFVNSSAADPYDNVPFNPAWGSHGTTVSSFASGETAETGTSPSGQLASIGFNTSMIAYSYWGNLMAKMLHASTVENADIINFSFIIHNMTYFANGPQPGNQNYDDMKLVIEEVLDNGTLLVAAVGNGNFGPNPAHGNFYPWADLYDGIVVVSATGPGDVFNHNGNQATKAAIVDLVAPGLEVMGARNTDPQNPNDWPYYGSYYGTSFASPIVAGVASLMYCENPCLSGAAAEDILKSTTDQPNTDWANYPGELGTGRVNAEKAVQAAQNYESSSIDLFTKAHEKDLGFPGSYSWIWGQHDNSPDIWVRQQPDGFENREHENPVYNNPGDKAYVYVRVRNKSCVSSLSNEPLSVYWNRASAGGSSWPVDWDGTNSGVGDKIGTLNIPSLGPGEHTIIEFEWELDNLGINNTSNVCLLSRIESTNDPITPYPQLHDEIFHNNNIALKNLKVVKTSLGGGLFDNQFPMPAGDVFRIGNPYDDAQNTYDVVFEVAPNLNYDLFEIGEVYVAFQEEFWDVLNQSSAQFEGIDIVENQMMQITSPQASITGLNYQEREMIDMYVGFAFFAEYAEVETEFMYTISQFDHNALEEESFRGSTHFRVIKEAGDYFEANAGGDQEIYTGDMATLQAVPINQSAQYKWYLGDSLVDTGLTLNVSPEANTSYKLEVTTDSTWYKAYDEAQVIVKHRWITNVSPNPATNNVLVEYDLKPGTANAHVTISNTSGTVSQNYTLNTSTPMSSINIDVSGLQTGAYSITLVADGVARQTKMLVKQ